MKDIWTVFCFTLRDGLRKKAFIITTVVVLVVILIACALPGIGELEPRAVVPPDINPFRDVIRLNIAERVGVHLPFRLGSRINQIPDS